MLGAAQTTATSVDATPADDDQGEVENDQAEANKEDQGEIGENDQADANNEDQPNANQKHEADVNDTGDDHIGGSTTTPAPHGSGGDTGDASDTSGS